MASRRFGRDTNTDNDALKGKLDRKGIGELLSLLRYMLPYKGKFALALLFLALSAFTSLSFPYLIGHLVDSALGSSAIGQSLPGMGRPLDLSALGLPRAWLHDLNKLALVLFGTLVVQALFSFGRILWFVEVGERSLSALRQDLYGRLIRLPMHFFAQRRVGELVSRISSDISQIQDTFTSTLAEFLRGIATLLIGIGILVFISPSLTLVMVSTLPVVVVVAIFFGRYIRRLSRQASDRLADANIVVEESLQGIQNVKAFTNETHESGRYGQAIGALVKVALRGATFRGAFASFIIFALFGAFMLVMWYGSTLVQQGLLSVGQLTSFLIYTMFVGGAMGSFGEQYSQLLKTVGATERVRELLNEPIEDIALGTPASTPTARVQGSVRFDDVHFTYPTRAELPVLRGLSFAVQPGEKVALVGPSGAGKSTLVSLLLRLYDPLSGSIAIDGKPIQSYALSSLRGQMAIVPQEVMLFGGSIRENIAYGRLDASESDIVQAAEQANAWQFIQSFPDGLDTIVGERGIKLSGGQRQRIAIARAVLRNPAILILDEATSSLDSESEQLVQAAMEQLMQGRTTFIIAHRLATVRRADTILVLQQGQIVEQGTHNELIQQPDGLYRQLASLQFTDSQIAANE